jgi:glycerol-3-phosphate dehydrogenase
LGAELIMPARVTGVVRRRHGVEVEYEEGGQKHQCQARVLVNAAGPWVNKVMACVTPAVQGLSIELVQGAHILVNGELQRGIYYLESPTDGRAVFAMPWRGRTMVGTTETAYIGDPAKVQPLTREREYLFNVLHHYFPHYAGTLEDRVDAFAGLRVLPAHEKDPFHRSRDTLLWTDDDKQPTLLTIYGGKLTAYRITAEEVMQRLQPVLPQRKARADTRRLRLSPVDGV